MYEQRDTSQAKLGVSTSSFDRTKRFLEIAITRTHANNQIDQIERIVAIRGEFFTSLDDDRFDIWDWTFLIKVHAGNV